MDGIFLKLYFKFQDLVGREEGQDLVEYALVVALIAFGATAGMGPLESTPRSSTPAPPWALQSLRLRKVSCRTRQPGNAVLRGRCALQWHCRIVFSH